ncbi:hypothetical protein PHYBLDRAFT_69017 [Phycomyces blakesleeanus NRRL 1555(-)]|uniref:Uncharacterized protein n=1 Tax=Phycomyces blakesleeanus (strain ATCC 8743b / DSM 1359 / FGSC 10004 / NBRC 33097 / NRRL 1555) TaxID=763407 RepID=A0A167KN24_PHYB8|nr:hypothetical protein PHYBLDRAFT_69017 [Phycomyces blakesleeanus NRRL 1555(-)]OAD68466.1 hypothetical protein PHYBLDRAFT_69017 [Phycomyces blakesleeanus NRRL 1555(-)]|eukprot:XP_018286506.1 hypothetical protein PHYBLDRAFT_69017 [Phycomyces blakesleeanus NRRL 1555(-)]
MGILILRNEIKLRGLNIGVSGARFPKKPGGSLLSLETRHSVDSPSTSTFMSPVPPVTAHHQTKPPKESTVRGTMAQWTRRLTTNQEIPGSTPGSLTLIFDCHCGKCCVFDPSYSSNAMSELTSVTKIGIYKQPVMVDFLG